MIMTKEKFTKTIASISECVNSVAKESTLLYSGGIDSTVLLYIIKDIVKRNNIPVYYIETGLNRESSIEKAIAFCKSQNINLNVVDIKEQIFKSLNGIVDYNERRTLLAGIFLETTKRITQGKSVIDATIRDDSRSLLIETKEFENIQPLKSLSKRKVLGLLKYLNIDKIYKAPLPFPSGGYSRKIIGVFNEVNLAMIKQVDEMFTKEINLKSKQIELCDVILWQSSINNFIFRISSNDKIDIAELEKIITKINKKFDFANKCLVDVSENVKKFYT